MKPIHLFVIDLLLAGAVVFLISSCANMGPNDGLVPMAGAQADMPYVPVASPVFARLGLQSTGSGTAVSPLAQKSQSFWQ